MPKKPKKLNIPKNYLPAVTVSILSSSMGYLLAPIEVRFIESISPSPAVTGLIYAFGTICLTILALWFGNLADKGYRRKLIFVGLLVALVYPILYANVVNALQYAGVKFFWAISGAAITPLIAGYIQDTLHDVKNKGQWFGYWYAAGSLAGAAAHFAGGLIAEEFGLRAPYYAITILALANIWVAFLFLKPQQHFDESSKGKTKFGFRYLVSKPQLKFYLTFNISIGLIFGVKYLLWPLIIFEMVQSDAATGAIFATMGIVAFIMLASSHYWADRFSPYLTYLVAATILAGTGAMVSLTSSIWIFWLAAAIFAIGEALPGPAQGIILTENINQEMRGRVLAADDVIDKILASISPLFAGFMLVYVTAQQAFFLYVAVLLISILIGSSIYQTQILKSMR